MTLSTISLWIFFHQPWNEDRNPTNPFDQGKSWFYSVYLLVCFSLNLTSKPFPQILWYSFSFLHWEMSLLPWTSHRRATSPARRYGCSFMLGGLHVLTLKIEFPRSQTVLFCLFILEIEHRTACTRAKCPTPGLYPNPDPRLYYILEGDKKTLFSNSFPPLTFSSPTV